MLLRAILCGGVWNGFLLGKAKKEDVLCRFCGCNGQGSVATGAGGQEEEEEEEEEEMVSSDCVSAFATALEATPVFECVFDDFWYDLSGCVTSSGFCGQRDGDGHLFWERTLQHVRELPEFATLMSLDRRK